MYTGRCLRGPWDGRECSYDETSFRPYIDGWLEAPTEQMDAQDLDPVDPNASLFTSGEYRWDGVRWIWHLHQDQGVGAWSRE